MDLCCVFPSLKIFVSHRISSFQLSMMAGWVWSQFPQSGWEQKSLVYLFNFPSFPHFDLLALTHWPLSLSYTFESGPHWFPSAAAKSLQSRLTLCDPIDGSPPGSPIPGILQARTLEWVAISSNAWKWKVKVKSSQVRLLVTPWSAAHQPPPSIGFSRQEYRSGVPLPSPWFPSTLVQI